MRITNSYEHDGIRPLNYGERLTGGVAARQLATALALVLPFFGAVSETRAQQANQPGFDPRQTEKYFDNQSDQESRRAPVKLPSLGRPDTGADATPQFVLRGVNVSGAHAVSRERLA